MLNSVFINKNSCTYRQDIVFRLTMERFDAVHRNLRVTIYRNPNASYFMNFI